MYQNRRDAGNLLADTLQTFHCMEAVVFGLPRGGVVTAAQVAKQLRLPLGVVQVSKIGHPLGPEYAIGAVAEENSVVYDRRQLIGIDPDWLDAAVAHARSTIRARQDYYRDAYVEPMVSNKTIIIVDDGMATGLTMQAACKAIKRHGAERLVVAVPVASLQAYKKVRHQADTVIVLEDPENFGGSVGLHYASFEQIDDNEVKELLRKSRYYQTHGSPSAQHHAR